jgi:Caspase domain
MRLGPSCCRRGALAQLSAGLLGAGMAVVANANVDAQHPARERGAPGHTHALLISVARPAALPQRLWLRGPDNDAALMRQALLERGVSADRITWLGRGPAAINMATRAAIEAAMQSQLQRLQPGDLLVLHLAGHGVQVPQRQGADQEPDALDEVFLAVDTQPWDAAQGLLPQALYDHDIGAFLDAAAVRGARVLALFDTCHAAGMHRGAAMATQRQRGVAALELGVPQGAAAVAASRARRAPAGAVTASLLRRPAQQQGWVLAFAGRSHESTPEAWMPPGSTQARVHGVFSYALVKALREGVEDAAALRRAMVRIYASEGRDWPVPLVLGEGRLFPPRP